MMNEKEKLNEMDATEAKAPVQEEGDQPGQSSNHSGEAEVSHAEGEIVEEIDATAITLENPEEIIARLEAEIAEANARADLYLDQMQRAAAEFQNVRRRQERQLQESIHRATEGIIRRLLPVLDDFALAFNNIPDSLEGETASWVEGFEKIHQKMASLLNEEGITAIEPTGPFDPNRHEAITHEPSETVESGHIIETLRIGYEYKDRVLRPALVRVAQ
ncbi:MAG: nucleotide exchange factor GrpE [Caldilineaceae bacterium]|nr:nucleotide exchange factor GrpE [Caldilineaceae bacterium]